MTDSLHSPILVKSIIRKNNTESREDRFSVFYWAIFSLVYLGLCYRNVKNVIFWGRFALLRKEWSGIL